MNYIPTCSKYCVGSWNDRLHLRLSSQEGYKSDVTDSIADELHGKLCSLPRMSTEVVIDDRRKLSIGRKVNEAKALGYPHLIVVGRPVRKVLYPYLDQIAMCMMRRNVVR